VHAGTVNHFLGSKREQKLPGCLIYSLGDLRAARSPGAVARGLTPVAIGSQKAMLSRQVPR